MIDRLDSLRQLHDAIVADLRAQYLDRVYTIAAYDPFPEQDTQERAPIQTPALLLELESIDPGDDDGTDRVALRLTLTLHCILSFRTAQQQIELREFAADVLAHVRHNRWGLGAAVAPPEALSAQPGEFTPDQPGYDSWRASWEQAVYVGTSHWVGTAPDEVYLGFAPRIGAAHIDDYFRVDTETVEAFDDL